MALFAEICCFFAKKSVIFVIFNGDAWLAVALGSLFLRVLTGVLFSFNLESVLLKERRFSGIFERGSRDWDRFSKGLKFSGVFSF